MSEVLDFASNCGMFTLMTFLLATSTLTSCLGDIKATSTVSSDMVLLASAKFLLAPLSPASIFSRRVLFSRTRSRNSRISSSRLSFKSLCPRTAVFSFPFRRFNSIRVALTVAISTSEVTGAKERKQEISYACFPPSPVIFYHSNDPDIHP